MNKVEAKPFRACRVHRRAKTLSMSVLCSFVLVFLWLCFTRTGLWMQLDMARRVDSSSWRRLVCSLLLPYAKSDNTIRLAVVSELLAISRRDALTVEQLSSEAIADNPDDPRYWYSRGLAYHSMFEHNRAICDFEEALRVWDLKPQCDLNFSRHQIEAVLGHLRDPACQKSVR
ncbi:MAG: hypothetical protein ACOX9C_00960 [Kiritimatiellia bacterium]|jgi:hypothetical protein